MNRFFGRFTRTISKPWQMYPIGVLFGLGFDTASEVALLFLAAGAAGAGQLGFIIAGMFVATWAVALNEQRAGDVSQPLDRTRPIFAHYPILRKRKRSRPSRL